MKNFNTNNNMGEVSETKDESNKTKDESNKTKDEGNVSENVLEEVEITPNFDVANETKKDEADVLENMLKGVQITPTREKRKSINVDSGEDLEDNDHELSKKKRTEHIGLNADINLESSETSNSNADINSESLEKEFKLLKSQKLIKPEDKPFVLNKPGDDSSKTKTPIKTFNRSNTINLDTPNPLRSSQSFKALNRRQSTVLDNLGNKLYYEDSKKYLLKDTKAPADILNNSRYYEFPKHGLNYDVVDGIDTQHKMDIEELKSKLVESLKKKETFVFGSGKIDSAENAAPFNFRVKIETSALRKKQNVAFTNFSDDQKLEALHNFEESLELELNGIENVIRNLKEISPKTPFSKKLDTKSNQTNLEFITEFVNSGKSVRDVSNLIEKISFTKNPKHLLYQVANSNIGIQKLLNGFFEKNKNFIDVENPDNNSTPFIFLKQAIEAELLLIGRQLVTLERIQKEISKNKSETVRNVYFLDPKADKESRDAMINVIARRKRSPEGSNDSKITPIEDVYKNSIIFPKIGAIYQYDKLLSAGVLDIASADPATRPNDLCPGKMLSEQQCDAWAITSEAIANGIFDEVTLPLGAGKSKLKEEILKTGNEELKLSLLDILKSVSESGKTLEDFIKPDKNSPNPKSKTKNKALLTNANSNDQNANLNDKNERIFFDIDLNSTAEDIERIINFKKLQKTISVSGILAQDDATIAKIFPRYNKETLEKAAKAQVIILADEFYFAGKDQLEYHEKYQENISFAESEKLKYDVIHDLIADKGSFVVYGASGSVRKLDKECEVIRQELNQEKEELSSAQNKILIRNANNFLYKVNGQELPKNELAFRSVLTEEKTNALKKWSNQATNGEEEVLQNNKTLSNKQYLVRTAFFLYQLGNNFASDELKESKQFQELEAALIPTQVSAKKYDKIDFLKNPLKSYSTQSKEGINNLSAVLTDLSNICDPADTRSKSFALDATKLSEAVNNFCNSNLHTILPREKVGQNITANSGLKKPKLKTLQDKLDIKLSQIEDIKSRLDGARKKFNNTNIILDEKNLMQEKFDDTMLFSANGDKTFSVQALGSSRDGKDFGKEEENDSESELSKFFQSPGHTDEVRTSKTPSPITQLEDFKLNENGAEELKIEESFSQEEDELSQGKDLSSGGGLFGIIESQLKRIKKGKESLLSSGEKGQYIMPDFKIDDQTCTDDDIENIMKLANVDILFLPHDKDENGKLKCKIVHSVFGSVVSEICDIEEIDGQINAIKNMINKEDPSISKDPSILSFFDQTNSIGGDYKEASYGNMVLQAIHVVDKNFLNKDYLFTLQNFMQCDRNRTGKNNRKEMKLEFIVPQGSFEVDSPDSSDEAVKNSLMNSIEYNTQKDEDIRLEAFDYYLNNYTKYYENKKSSIDIKALIENSLIVSNDNEEEKSDVIKKPSSKIFGKTPIRKANSASAQDENKKISSSQISGTQDEDKKISSSQISGNNKVAKRSESTNQGEIFGKSALRKLGSSITNIFKSGNKSKSQTEDENDLNSSKKSQKVASAKPVEKLKSIVKTEKKDQTKDFLQPKNSSKKNVNKVTFVAKDEEEELLEIEFNNMTGEEENFMKSVDVNMSQDDVNMSQDEDDLQYNPNVNLERGTSKRDSKNFIEDFNPIINCGNSDEENEPKIETPQTHINSDEVYETKDEKKEDVDIVLGRDSLEVTDQNNISSSDISKNTALTKKSRPSRPSGASKNSLGLSSTKSSGSALTKAFSVAIGAINTTNIIKEENASDLNTGSSPNPSVIPTEVEGNGISNSNPFRGYRINAKSDSYIESEGITEYFLIYKDVYDEKDPANDIMITMIAVILKSAKENGLNIKEMKRALEIARITGDIFSFLQEMPENNPLTDEEKELFDDEGNKFFCFVEEVRDYFEQVGIYSIHISNDSERQGLSLSNLPSQIEDEIIRMADGVINSSGESAGINLLQNKFSKKHELSDLKEFINEKIEMVEEQKELELLNELGRSRSDSNSSIETNISSGSSR